MAQTNTKFAEYLDGPDDNWSAKVIDCKRQRQDV